jgi:hypothetical protein
MSVSVATKFLEAAVVPLSRYARAAYVSTGLAPFMLSRARYANALRTTHVCLELLRHDCAARYQLNRGTD